MADRLETCAKTTSRNKENALTKYSNYKKNIKTTRNKIKVKDFYIDTHK